MIKYADIEYYLEINNKYFAFINLHNKKDSLSILPESSGYFYNIVRSYFSEFYKVIEFTNEFNLIEAGSIINKCIIINNNEYIFLTELSYEFEHD